MTIVRTKGPTLGAAMVASISILAVSGATHAETNWDMPMAYPAANYHTENAQTFVDAVSECTGGSLEITIHPNGSLFKGDEIKRAVQIGEAQIGERLLSAHANENAIFGYDSVPFLASSFEASDALRDAARPTLNSLLNEQGLTLLYSVPWPPQGLYFNQEVMSTADVAGVKFRAYNAATARVAELAGMTPTQIEASELKQALSTGVVSSFISSGSTGADEKVWEDLSHFYDAKAWLPRNTIFVNSDAFSELSVDEQNCLTTHGADAEAAGSAKAAELSDGFLKQLADGGMSVQDPGDQLASDLSEIGETMTAEWLEQAGEGGAAILDGFNAK